MQQLWILLFCCSVSLGQRLAQKWLDPRRGPEELTRYGGEFRHGPYGTLDTRDPSEELLRQRGLAPNDQDRYGYLLSDQQGPSEQGHWKRVKNASLKTHWKATEDHAVWRSRAVRAVHWRFDRDENFFPVLIPLILNSSLDLAVRFHLEKTACPKIVSKKSWPRKDVICPRGISPHVMHQLIKEDALCLLGINLHSVVASQAILSTRIGCLPRSSVSFNLPQTLKTDYSETALGAKLTEEEEAAREVLGYIDTITGLASNVFPPAKYLQKAIGFLLNNVMPHRGKSNPSYGHFVLSHAERNGPAQESADGPLKPNAEGLQ
ncbi:hypothetical protein L596_013123 [Steinernema carpocapsae]|uniref:Uncharacterized protein n=1 Tax=Steinernema carpocapsae TaxID=34508 RepID=A0A4U5NZ97_STECR|nr:hypothetical protein L596_013123 [Steinernema carpocapsae]